MVFQGNGGVSVFPQMLGKVRPMMGKTVGIWERMLSIKDACTVSQIEQESLCLQAMRDRELQRRMWKEVVPMVAASCSGRL